jgi:putative transposase
MIYQFMKDNRGSHCVEKMAEVFHVSRSGFYAWVDRPESTREAQNTQLTEEIREIQGQVHSRYGAPRMTAELKRRGTHAGRHRVARIMQENELGAHRKKRFRVTTRSAEGSGVAENALDRCFRVPTMNTVWVSDITYVATAEGWLYLCVIIDLYSRRVVGWSMGTTLATELVLSAFMMAVMRRRPPRGLMFHSDRGVQYASKGFRTVLSSNKMIQSMSRKGECWDNACAETFFKTLKTELIGPRIYKTREEAKAAIFEYIEVFYNRVRLHSYLGYTTPVEYEQAASRQSAA